MMRLTLRTLLAYLDDVLAPADTKIIGQKIHESPMAQLLVSRIREVMRRRRLKAPEVFGPEMGIDPNIVSQYLDNSLPAERYADVERVLLASDEMLAEAAACHQILTVVFGDPLEVPQSTRDRLYALGPVEASSQLAVPNEPVTRKTPESIPVRNGAVTGRDGVAHPGYYENERITTVPDYLKPTPWSQKFVPTAIVAVLILICAALLAPGFKNAFQQANNEIQRKVDRDKQATSNGTDSTEDDSVASPAATKPDGSTQVAAASIVSKLPPGVDPTPPKDAVEDSIPGPDSKEGDGPASALNPAGTASNATVPPAANPPQTPIVTSPINYISNEGVVVRFDPAQRHWLTLPHKSSVSTGDIVANLEPFDGLFEFDKIGIRGTLVGESVVKFLDPRESGVPGVGVGRGRIIFQSRRQDEERPGPIAIAIGEDLWKLELRSNDTVCALEVTPRESTQFQKLNDYHWYQAMLYVVSGSVTWTNRDEKSLEIGDHMALNIIPEKAAIVRSNPMSFPAPPDWCETVKRKLMPLRKYQSVFERSFEPEKPIDGSILALVKSSKNPKIAELAARCLSATDNFAALVETLAECPHEEARFAARDGLRQWLPMNPDHGRWLKDELEMHYPPSDADAIYRMLWGFSREDVKDSKATAWLFTNWMRSPRLEIRELADYWVERLSRKTEYRASAPPSQRESQVRRLEELIERDNGLIKSQ